MYTERKSILVVSRDGYILWARSSRSAYKSGIYYKTSNVSPIPVPIHSLAGLSDQLSGSEHSKKHVTGVWFDEACDESVIISDEYDLVISLVHFS